MAVRHAAPVVVLVLALALALALALCRPVAAEPARVHVELDPLTFASGGYGGQVGVRHPALHGVRFAIASFALHVPDAIAQLGGNDGFDVRVRPSVAAYALYYVAPAGDDGLAFGASIRYLRFRYRRDDAAGASADTREVSPELLAAYQWHPWHNGFYLQPWLALGVTLHRSGSPTVAGHAYEPPPVSPFFTVNVGWEQRL